MDAVPRDRVTAGLVIDAPAERVWRFLTADRGAWWPEMRFDPVVGARLVETWTVEGTRMSATGVVTECAEPRLLAFSWSDPAGRLPLDVVIRLVGDGPTTAVTVDETGFVRGRTPPSSPAEHEEGWRFHLARWKRVSEGGSVGI